MIAARLLCFFAVALLLASTALAQTTLKPPLSQLAWMLGDWTCTSVNWETGAPEPEHVTVSYHVVADPSGLAIHSRSESGAHGYLAQGQLGWIPQTSTYYEQDSASSDRSEFRTDDVARPSDVTPLKMTFVGRLQASGNAVSPGYEARERVTTSRTGMTSFREVTDYWTDGAWKRMDVTTCVRSTATR